MRKSVLQNQGMCDIITKINRMSGIWKGKFRMSAVGCKSYYEYVNDQAMQYEVYGLYFVYSYKIRK